MEPVKRLIFRSIVGVFKAYRDLFLDFRVWGRERIPPGPKIYVTNHITSTDPTWVLPVFTEPVHIIIGPGYQMKVLGWALDYLEQINAMPEHRKTVEDSAVKYLMRGEAIYTAPEGDLHDPFHPGKYFPGVARIYRRARVPIIPIALLTPRSRMKEMPVTTVVDGRVYRNVLVLRGPFCANVGEPFTPDVSENGDANEDQHIMDELRERMRRLIDDIRINKFWQ